MIEKTPGAMRPYGDTAGDGAVQLSFTLPMARSPLCTEAAKALASRMGLEGVHVAHEEQIAEGFTFFVLYGSVVHSVDLDGLTVTAAEYDEMDMHEADEYIERRVGRAIRVVGACIESDAHTVGIDAILNMKGFAGDYGLERYSRFAVKNMGAQVRCEALIAEAVGFEADVVLVSTVVTQKNIHIHHLTKLIDMLEAEGLRDRFLLVVGGPQVTHGLAKELGFDAGFGRGTSPSQVASYIAKEMALRVGAAGES